MAESTLHDFIKYINMFEDTDEFFMFCQSEEIKSKLCKIIKPEKHDDIIVASFMPVTVTLVKKDCVLETKL